MSSELIQPGVNIVSSAELLEDGQEMEQLSVIHVIKPWHHGNLSNSRKRTNTQHFSTKWRFTDRIRLQNAYHPLPEFETKVKLCLEMGSDNLLGISVSYYTTTQVNIRI